MFLKMRDMDGLSGNQERQRFFRFLIIFFACLIMMGCFLTLMEFVCGGEDCLDCGSYPKKAPTGEEQLKVKPLGQSDLKAALGSRSADIPAVDVASPSASDIIISANQWKTQARPLYSDTDYPPKSHDAHPELPDEMPAGGDLKQQPQDGRQVEDLIKLLLNAVDREGALDLRKSHETGERKDTPHASANEPANPRFEMVPRFKRSILNRDRRSKTLLSAKDIYEALQSLDDETFHVIMKKELDRRLPRVPHPLVKNGRNNKMVPAEEQATSNVK